VIALLGALNLKPLWFLGRMIVNVVCKLSCMRRCMMVNEEGHIHENNVEIDNFQRR
jgi:hypothetical protein